jgi:hypothetical protein
VDEVSVASGSEQHGQKLPGEVLRAASGRTDARVGALSINILFIGRQIKVEK